jgi:choline-sulfatase
LQPQNMLILMSDEHNPKMMGSAGHPLVKTPHLDALAARGTRFSQAYTNCPICVPARASFATGRYVHELEYWDNAIAYDGRVEGWGHRLQDAGYRVESIGKLHYRNDADPVGLDVQHLPMHIKDGVGMVHLSIRNQFADVVPFLKPNGIIAAAGPGESDYTRYDRAIADLACQWLGDAGDSATPWVLFVSFVTPHFPLLAPEEFFAMYPPASMPLPKAGPGSNFQTHAWLQNYVEVTDARGYSDEQHRIAAAAYLGLVSFMDAQVGRVVGALQANGLGDNTRIMYTSDHGENAGVRGLWGKSNHYQEAGGIPMIIAGAGVPEGRVSTTPVTLVDAHPTVLQGTGLAYGNDGTPGRSLLDLANGDDEPERVAFSEYHAARSPSAAYMVRKGRYKYIHYVGYEPELFDLRADPEEMRDLSSDPAYAEVRAQMYAQLCSMLDPQAVDARANAAQKALVESRGGPQAVLARLVTDKAYTPVPQDLIS